MEQEAAKELAKEQQRFTLAQQQQQFVGKEEDSNAHHPHVGMSLHEDSALSSVLTNYDLRQIIISFI